MEIGITDLLIHKLSASLNVSRPLDPNKLQCLETDLTGISPRTRWIQNPIETISYDFRIINHQTFKAFLDKHSYFRPGKGAAMQCQCNVKFCLVHQSHPRSHSSCHWWQKSPPVVSKAWSHQAWKSPEHMVGLRFFSLSHCHEWLSRDESKVMAMAAIVVWWWHVTSCYTVCINLRRKSDWTVFDRGCTSSPLQRKLLAYWPCISGATPALTSWYPKRQCIHRCYCR